MKITDWLTTNKISDAEFASRIGVSRQALWRYKSGERIPKRDIIERILHETDGEVRPADFFSIPETAA